MQDRIYILGGHQTDFARNYSREGSGIDQVIFDTIDPALKEVQIDESFIDVFHIGNFIGELTVHQAHLGGFISELFPGFASLPAARHEAACASGGIALLSAISDILSGRYSTAAVLGVEMEKSKSGDEVADHLGVAAWYDRECAYVQYPWPKLFSDVGDVYDNKYGLKAEHLKAISRSHYSNALNNENAQTRKWTLPDKAFEQDDEANPVIMGRIRKRDCSQITDGGAMVVLANSRKAASYARERNLSVSDIPYIKGWGYTTGPITLEAKWPLSNPSGLLFPHLEKAIVAAMHRAGMSDVFQVDAIETHDCFTTSAYMAIDHFGITAPGENWKAIEEGWIFRDGKLPMNSSGGLIGVGHPVGATGVRMVLDAYKQITVKANGYQLENCRNVATLNIGGSVTTCVTFIIGK